MKITIEGPTTVKMVPDTDHEKEVWKKSDTQQTDQMMND